MIQIRFFRFILPPMVMLVILWWGAFMDPAENFHTFVKPIVNIIDNYPNLKEYIQVTAGFVVTPLAVFGAGFIISTVSTILLRIFNVFDCSSQGPGVYWEKGTEEKLRRVGLQIKNFRQQGEFCEQALLSQVPDNLIAWTSRRWEYFITNFQAMIACLFSCLLFIPLLINPTWFGGIVICAFGVCLGWNAIGTFREAMGMDHFILNNLERLSINQKKSCLEKEKGKEMVETGDKPEDVTKGGKSKKNISDQSAGVLLLSTQQLRTHWSSIITNHFGYAIIVNTAIWSFFLKATVDSTNSGGPMTSYIAIAVSVSAILIGLWRYYTHHIDNHIAGLYPDFLFCEGIMDVPSDYGTSGYLKRAVPQLTRILDQDSAHNQKSKIISDLVNQKSIGDRNHKRIDLISLIVIVIMLLLIVALLVFKKLEFYKWYTILGFVGIFIGLLFLQKGYCNGQKNPSDELIQEKLIKRKKRGTLLNK